MSAERCSARSSDRARPLGMKRRPAGRVPGRPSRKGNEDRTMSRIGKKPVSLPQGVTANVSGQTVTAKGPKGELEFVVNDEVLVKMENNQIEVEPRHETKSARAKWGMSRTQIVNIL